MKQSWYQALGFGGGGCRSLAMAASAAAAIVLAQPALRGDPLDHWQVRVSMAEDQSLNGVAYGDGHFVAVGDNGVIVSSVDGVSWERRESGTTKGLDNIAYGNGSFLAASSSGNALLASTDGANWQSVPFPEPETSVLRGLAFAHDRFFLMVTVATGDAPAKQVPALFTSATTTNWTRVDLGAEAAVLCDLAYGEGLYVSVGYTEASGWEGQAGPYLRVSSGGTSWDTVTLSSGWQIQFEAVAYGGGVFVATDNAGSKVAYSSDGREWSLTQTGLSNPHSVDFGSGLFCAVGDLGTLSTSMNGREWMARSSGTTSSLTDVVHGNGTFVAVGARGLILQSAPVIVLGLDQASPGALAISGPIGQSCQIESASEISAASNWEVMGSVVLTAGSTMWTDPRPAATSQRFYRVVVQP